MKQGWKTYRLGDICTLNYGKALTATNRVAGDIPVYSSAGITGSHNVALVQSKGIIVGRKGTVGTVYYSDKPFYCIDTAYYILPDDEKYDFKWLYYRLKSLHLDKLNEDSAVPGLNRETAYAQEFPLPPLEEQRRIAGILGAIDDKIENNRRINTNLELQAQALFDEWFITNTFRLGVFSKAYLTDIANYLNGLAMQRFRPLEGEIGIPVLKIKELGQGQYDSSSDLCSPSIEEKYIVRDGDIIFSWSGTLLVDIWCGGVCGLNQHLFKVTSDKYPQWFIYYWTKHHLAKFIRIAKDKAVTMGHIKRGDLEVSEVLIPEEKSFAEIDKMMSPIFKAIIANRIANRHLATLRDTLLPKLMNGEIITK